MISNFNQPAKNWLADVLNNLGNFLKDDEDPSFTITIDGAEIEIRLNNLPGEYCRSIIDAGRRAFYKNIAELNECSNCGCQLPEGCDGAFNNEKECRLNK